MARGHCHARRDRSTRGGCARRRRRDPRHPDCCTETLLETQPDGAVALVAAPEELARAQTPQAFDARLLLAAYDQAHINGFEGTDTASSLERLGHAIRAVYSSDENIKVTTPDDLLRAEATLRARSERSGD